MGSNPAERASFPKCQIQGECGFDKIAGSDFGRPQTGPEHKRGVSIMDDANNPAERANPDQAELFFARRRRIRHQRSRP